MNLASIPLASIIILLIAIAGAIIVIVHPETLSFATYIKYVGISAGILGVGRGLDATHKP